MRTPVLLCSCVLFAAALACGPTPSTPDAGEPAKCVGGVLRPDGTCEAKCDRTKCVPGNICVDNKCVLECDAHDDCVRYAQECQPAVEDDTLRGTFVCQSVPVREYGDPCPLGIECGTNVCLSSGPGDARSYCTMACLQDSECPGGYECGYVRDPHTRCGGPAVGNNNFCGRTTDACIDQSLSPLDGSGPYVLSSYCLQRRLCTKRDVCAPCSSNVDCSWAGLDCVDIGEDTKRCLAQCQVDSDCERDKACIGAPGTVKHCAPRYGACRGTGAFCEPCRFDTDCGQGFACADLHGNETACIDMSFSKTCSTDLDCPLSPSGLRGDCVQVSGGLRCYAPQDDANNAYSCW